MEAVNRGVKSAGGVPGIGGIGADGLMCNRHFTGFYRRYQKHDCHGFLGLSCDVSTHHQYGGYSSSIKDSQCHGQSGKNGTAGVAMNPW